MKTYRLLELVPGALVVCIPLALLTQQNLLRAVAHEFPYH